MRRLLAVLGSYAGPRGIPGDSPDRASFAKALLALSRTLATHVECYEGEVVPAIRRTLFHAQAFSEELRNFKRAPRFRT